MPSAKDHTIEHESPTDITSCPATTTGSPYGKLQTLHGPSSSNRNGSDDTEPHIAVLVSRTDLIDDPSYTYPELPSPPIPPSIPAFRFSPPTTLSTVVGVIDIVRVPPSRVTPQILPSGTESTKNTTMPVDPALHKYWHQRHRLFSKFDSGVELDREGWFSVTPEQIADHVAQEATTGGISPVVVLDAFGGCGGNSIAFARRPNVDKVISVDIDRNRLRLAARNASIYGIPTSKLVFLECNAVFILQYCYRSGVFVLDQPLQNAEEAMKMMAAMPPPVETERCHGYTIGGIDELPRTISMVFMDPPWGGVDYNCLFGKNGYSLQNHMRIPRLNPKQLQAQQVSDNFFDTFSPSNEHERKASFNCGLDETNCVNGSELLAFAAAAAPYVVYDVPKNTNRTSLAQAALDAGYRGNYRLDEHYLNGRLKTVSAYFGVDWGQMLGSDG